MTLPHLSDPHYHAHNPLTQTITPTLSDIACHLHTLRHSLSPSHPSDPCCHPDTPLTRPHQSSSYILNTVHSVVYTTQRTLSLCWTLQGTQVGHTVIRHYYSSSWTRLEHSGAWQVPEADGALAAAVCLLIIYSRLYLLYIFKNNL